MNDNDRDREEDIASIKRYLVALVLILACLGMSRCNRVHAQSDEELTGRVCVSETRSADECAQIVHATAERAVMRGRSYRAELQTYSPRATGRRTYVGREWIGSLRVDGPLHESFVEPMNHEVVRTRFVAFVVVAWQAMHGQREAPCLSATEWAAPWCARCRRRMRRAGCLYAVCMAPMANDWWVCS